MLVLLFDIDCICEMGSCPWNDFLVRGVTLSMSGNARKGPHCIGIVFLCQKWRLWGLFFAGRDFAMKSMLPLIRHNVFLTAGHSPFLELLTLQKGPIAPFSVTTALFGRNGRFGGTRRRSHARRLPSASRCVTCCSSPAVRCQSPGSVNRCLPFAVWRLVLAILFGRCRLPLASRLCRSPLAASPGACSFPSA